MWCVLLACELRAASCVLRLPTSQTRALSRLGRLRSHAAQLRYRLHIKALPLAHSTCLHKQVLSSTKQPNLIKDRLCPALSLSHQPSASTNLCSTGCKSSSINAEHTRRLTPSNQSRSPSKKSCWHLLSKYSEAMLGFLSHDHRSQSRPLPPRSPRRY